jgi:hypothetical protein
MTDYNEARRFLQLLDPDATAFTFQTFDDSPRKDSALARVRHGSLEDLWPELVQLGEMGAGTFVTVNDTDGKGRTAENITRQRTNWIDADDAKGIPNTPLEPSIGVRTSPGKGHLYFVVTDSEMTPEQHRGIQERLIADYGSDPNAKDVARVLRLPGTYHRKDPSKPHLVRLVPELSSGARYTTAQLIEAFPPISVEAVAAEPADPEPVDPARVRAALKRIPADDRKVWLGVGMAIKHGLGESGFELWREWSAASHKYNADDQRKTWASLKRTDANGKVVTLRSVFKLAKEGGWDGKADGDVEDSEDSGKRKSQADMLIEIAVEAQLFYSPDGGRYADVPVNGHVETMDIDGPDFRDWLQDRYFRRTKRGVGSEAVKTAIQTIRARSRSADDAVERRVHLRVAEHDGKLYIDIGDKSRRAIEVDYTGWRIVGRPPCRFLRKPGMAALPEPVHGGSIDDLRRFLRTEGDDFVLIVAWMLGSLRGGASQYAILAYKGAGGSGKSTRARFVRRLVDPNEVIDQGAPKSKDDLLVSAEDQHVVVLDNLSSLSAELSDTICRLSDGSGDRKRKLYTDGQVHVFKGRRPLMITSTRDVLTKSDASDRVLFVDFKRIPDNERIEDEELEAAYTKAAPGVLGALLDAMVCGLRTMGVWRYCGNKPMGSVLRLTSFERWVTACEGGLAWPAGTLRQAFENNKRRRLDMLVEVEPVIGALTKLLDGGDFGDVMDADRVRSWHGTATQLLDALNMLVDGRIRQSDAWPKRPHFLSGMLNEQVEALKEVGITFERDREKDPVTKKGKGPQLLFITKNAA